LSPRCRRHRHWRETEFYAAVGREKAVAAGEERIYAMIATWKPCEKSVGEEVAAASLERQISNLRKKAAKLGVAL
jgi:hypothetical protein